MRYQLFQLFNGDREYLKVYSREEISSPSTNKIFFIIISNELHLLKGRNGISTTAVNKNNTSAVLMILAISNENYNNRNYNLI